MCFRTLKNFISCHPVICFNSRHSCWLVCIKKTTGVSKNFGPNFISILALLALNNIYLAILAYGPYSSGHKSPTVIYVSFGGLLVSIPCAVRFGMQALLPAIGIGAGIGSYLSSLRHTTVALRPVGLSLR
jgi:hypothetical protein